MNTDTRAAAGHAKARSKRLEAYQERVFIARGRRLREGEEVDTDQVLLGALAQPPLSVGAWAEVRLGA